MHDMRDVFQPDTCDFVFNLFTSYGYFRTGTENAVALRAAVAALKPGGKLVIDFMNTLLAIPNLVVRKIKEANRIIFRIQQKLEDDFIVKTISFEGQGQP